MADVPSFLKKGGEDEDAPKEPAPPPPPPAGDDQADEAPEDDFLARLRETISEPADAPLKAVPIPAEPIDEDGSIEGMPSIQEAETGGAAVAEVLFNKALDAHDNGELEQALDLYRQAVEADPRNVVAWNNLGMVYIDIEDLDSAEAALVETLKVDPGYGEAYNNLGFVFRRRGMDPQAAWCYERFLEAEPNAQDTEKIRSWAQAVAQTHGPPPAPESLQGIIGGEAPPAASPLEAVEEAPKIQRTSGWEVSMRGGEGAAAPAQSEAGAFPEQKVEKVSGWEVPVSPEVTRTEETADAVCERGMELFDQGDHDGAERELRKAVSLDPSFAPAHSELGKVLVKMERYDEGAFELQQAVSRQPDDAGSFYVLGFALRSTGKDAEAAEAYVRFLELMPDAEEAESIGGWIASVRGEEAPADEVPAPAEAVSTLEPVGGGEAQAFFAAEEAPAVEEAQPSWLVAEAEPAAPPADQLAAAPALPGATPPAEPGLEMSPAEQAYQRALEAFQDSNMDEALSACEQAAALDDSMAKAHLLMGRILIRLEDYLRAVTALRRGGELAPGNPEIYFFLGQAYEKRGLSDEARAAYQQCLEVAPDGPQAQRVSEWLRQAEEAGRATTGVRCEYCLRTFPAEEMTVHDNKNCCSECLSTLGVAAPAGADAGVQEAAEVPLADYEEEEEIRPKKGILRRFFRLVFILLFLAVVGVVVAFVGHHMEWFRVPDQVIEHPHVKPYLTQVEDLLHKYTGWPEKKIVAPPPPPPPPPEEVLDMELASTPPAEVKLLKLWEYKLELRNVPEGEDLVVEIEGAPEGMGYYAESQTIRWTPGAAGAVELPSSREIKILVKAGKQAVEQKVRLELDFRVSASEPRASGVDPTYFRYVATGDLNGDKRDDVALAAGRYRSGELRIFYQQDVGGFSDARVMPPLSGQPGDVKVLDLNGDGRKDVLLTEWMHGKLLFYAQNDAGDLDGPVAVDVGKGPISVSAADFGGGGSVEAAVICSSSEALAVVGLEGGVPKVRSRVSMGLPPGWGRAVAGSFLGEGKQLVVMLSGTGVGDQLRLYSAKGGGGLEQRAAASPFEGVHVDAAILSRKGAPDQLVALFGGEKAKVVVLAWDAGGKVSKVAELACDQNPKALCSGDLNGDGVGDLAIGYGDGVELYLGRAEGFLPLKNVDVAGGCMYLRPADANADGTEDVVVLTGDGKIVAILMEP